jgi:SAM-dependent MidA family methyltransferase
MSRRSNDAATRAGAESVELSKAALAPSLEERLRERIRRGGPLSFCEWMRAALYDEGGGYYQKRGGERWGRAGDYRTSPERTPLFAATFARRFAALYEELGSQPALHILESGGGAGRFARVALETLRRDAPQVFSKVHYIFDESGEGSREQAAALLAPFRERVEFRRLREITHALDPVIVFSNELLDAFPVHRVVQRGAKLSELYVDVDARGNLVWLERETSTPRLAEHFGRLGVMLPEGQIAEVSLEAEEWVERVARLIGRGYVFTVDYGDDAANLVAAPQRREGTLRAFRGHELVEDVLRSPGEQDLTTTVNWTQVVAAGERAGLRAVALERLDSFLMSAGLLEQLEVESARAGSDSEVAGLRLGAREMILPGGMASHFQVLVQKKI